MTHPSDSALLLTFARRGEDQAIREALAVLERERPGARVFAVATQDSAARLEALGISDLIVLEAARPAHRVLAEVAGRRPAATAIVYSDPSWRGHLKLEIVALRSVAPTIYRCSPEGGTEVVGRLRLLGSVVCKVALTAAHCAAAACVSGIAFCWLRAAQLMTGGPRASRA